MVFDEKSDYSYKEILLPLSETLFYFTEKEVKEADPKEKGGVILPGGAATFTLSNAWTTFTCITVSRITITKGSAKG